MSSRPQSSYDDGQSAHDFAQGNPNPTSPLSQSMNQNTGVFTEEFEASNRGSSILNDGAGGVDRTHSTSTTAVPASAPSRNNTLKKRNSVKRASSLKRSSSKRSLKAGSLAGFGGVDSNKEFNSAFSTPIPTQGTPTDILANRFQAWRQLLKSLIAYFREIQASYEMRAKAAHKVQASIQAISMPSIFMSENGLGEATNILNEFHKKSISEANKSREIETDVIGALTGLRSDLGQKIKEIKSLSGDFKNSVEKEKDNTRREVEKLQEALRGADHEDGSATGKNDPFVVKLGVDRAVERQIDEENYLHRAYLNLESSGRELESIVVGEIQKAYNALAGILKREGDDCYTAVEGLRSGPISMPKDAEWMAFVQNDAHFVDPHVPLRRTEDIEFPGKNHPAAAEVRAGMLERKSKYLKSYTPGWYVLSSTHLHEFKSADKIYTQPPVMSLYLPDQKLGSHSNPDSSSHKFMVKGRQSGSMHKGHNWVFRAETYDTMMAWFEDMRVLTEKTGEERNAFVRKHARSFSGTSERDSTSMDGMEEDEADAVPYSADVSSLAAGSQQEQRPQRPQPGGRFPSDMNINRDRGVTQSSGSSDPQYEGLTMAGGMAAGGMASSVPMEYDRSGEDPYRLDGVSAGTRPTTAYSGVEGSYFEQTPSAEHTRNLSGSVPHEQETQSFLAHQPAEQQDLPADQGVAANDWMIAPVAAGVGVGGLAAAAAQAPKDQEQETVAVPPEEAKPEVPEKSSLRSSPPESTTVDATSADHGPDATPDVVPAAAPMTTADGATDENLGGLESEGAHETGTLFPTVIRHNTDMSISQLHVPGKFPKQS